MQDAIQFMEISARKCPLQDLLLFFKNFKYVSLNVGCVEEVTLQLIWIK